MAGYGVFNWVNGGVNKNAVTLKLNGFGAKVFKDVESWEERLTVDR